MGDINFKDSLNNAMPFIAIGIFMMLIVTSILLFREQNLKKEISENCGWGEEDYYCYCEKSKAMEVKNRMESEGLPSLNWSGRGVEDVELAG